MVRDGGKRGEMGGEVEILLDGGNFFTGWWEPEE